MRILVQHIHVVVEVTDRDSDRVDAHRLRQRSTQRVVRVHWEDGHAARTRSACLELERYLQELALRIDRDGGRRVARGVHILRDQCPITLHRELLHRRVALVDPDCVAVTPSVDWRLTSQWMDVVARSGTSLFLSPDPAAVTPEIKSAMKDAMFLASQGGHGFPLNPTSGTTPAQWRFLSPNEVDRKYDWCGLEGTSPFAV